MSFFKVAWRALSQIIIFVYLMVEETSLLILVPAGISVLIEVWKMCKAFKVKIEWKLFPQISFGESSKSEQETNSYDSIVIIYYNF